jgi:2-polyprenyl-6-methoxyphenol hydroxylase-like FAD-dependent oxidoreductase
MVSILDILPGLCSPIVDVRQNGGRPNLVAGAVDEEPAPPGLATLKELFAGFAGDARRLIDRLDADPPLLHDLVEIDRPTFGRRVILLVGDAAHAMTPNLGQGAAMGIEDAIAVKVALRDGVDGVAVRYDQLRRRRVRRIQLRSRRIGQLAHLGHPALRRGRDTLLAAIPKWSIDRQHARLVRPGLDLAVMAAR